MYQFKGTVGIFYVLAALYQERAICDHIFDGKSSCPATRLSSLVQLNACPAVAGRTRKRPSLTNAVA